MANPPLGANCNALLPRAGGRTLAVGLQPVEVPGIERVRLAPARRGVSRAHLWRDYPHCYPVTHG